MGTCVARENRELTASEKFALFRTGTAINYRLMKASMGSKMDQAKIDYAPQLEYSKAKYNIARLKVKGYSAHNEDD